MASPSSKIPLPEGVESMIREICLQKCQPLPDAHARRFLARLGEKTSIDILTEASSWKKIQSFSAVIVHLAKKYTTSPPTEESVYHSPLKRPSSTSYSPLNSPNGAPKSTVTQQLLPTFFSPSPVSSPIAETTQICRSSPSAKRKIRLASPTAEQESTVTQQFSPTSMRPIFPAYQPESTGQFSPAMMALSNLEFRKAFLILSYIGRHKLEESISAQQIYCLQHTPIIEFETKVWTEIGQHVLDIDRRQYLDWDSRKTHLYHCHVYLDGTYTFKGPYLSNTRTHLQRALGDDNVLMVKFAEEATDPANNITGSISYGDAFKWIAEEGILVGLRRFRFFVFKDGGKEEKRKSPFSSSVKCYFVRMESLAQCNERESYILSNKTIYEARCLFMHVHMVSSLAKYMARFSLVLSKTIKLDVDFATIDVRIKDDIPCCDENGHIVCTEDGEPVIHSDGTGYISEDLALKIPKCFSKAKFINSENLERFLLEAKSAQQEGSREPPLLMQIRLFHNGRAVKGTLLINKQLSENTIWIRPSMIKVPIDPRLSNAQTFNSLEIVGISNKPRRTYLSRNLIALLSYGGVPNDYFLELLRTTLDDARRVYTDKRAALKVALNHGEMDYDFTVARMILSGVPLNEPYLQHRLPVLAKEERKGLKEGKLPISESFYLIGTVDPTGYLNHDQVCVVLENGQISGDVLVYRNPGLHFGDIHVLKAVYVEALSDYVGNAKYGIFFSSNGLRSKGSEMANGDFDGDVYWVSRNPQLLMYFKASEPWRRVYSTPNASSIKPSELPNEEIDKELFKLFITTRFHGSSNMGVAADSWLAFMDRLLILGDCSSDEKDRMKESMHQLVDIYYDALDAPKSGKKVVVPDELKAEKFPHYMGRPNNYKSKSVLGLIYEEVESFQCAELSKEDVEIKILPCFEVGIPAPYLNQWRENYGKYRSEMAAALSSDKESKDDAANSVIQRYKELLYGAAEFQESTKTIDDLYYEALAIYRVVYDYAIELRDVKKCGFAWRVAGPVLFELYFMKQSEKKSENPIICSPSVLREVLNSKP